MNLKQYINKFAPEIWEYKDCDFAESFISLTLDYLGSFEEFKREDVELLNKYGYDDIDFIEVIEDNDNYDIVDFKIQTTSYGALST